MVGRLMPTQLDHAKIGQSLLYQPYSKSGQQDAKDS
jgi:hypothetical protein